MQVMSVTGPVNVDSLGIILPHEHLFIDLRNQFTEFSDPEKRAISCEKVSMHNLGRLRLNPYAIRDNLLLDDFDTAAEEVGHFKKLNGKTIVDCTSIGINRDARRLRELSLKTGVTIIAGSGYYTQDTHPKEMRQWRPEDIAEQIIRDLTEGIDGTDIKAGVIGEIGTSEPIHPDEEKNLIASALAFNKTGAPVYVHTYPWGKGGLQAANILIEHGVDPSKIVICHLDVEPDIGLIKEVLKRGVYLEFDDFGKEFCIEPADRGFAGGFFIRDIERVRLVKQMIEWGFGSQILLTTDICLKMLLRAYGGWGYGHILKNIVPLMKYEGIDEEQIRLVIEENPKRLLS